MHLDLNLTKNLVLHYLDENMTNDDELTTVELWFSFFGESGQAYITIGSLENEYPSYIMTEINSKLSESFNELLEQEEIYDVIKEKVRLFHKQWNEENKD